MQTAIRSVTNLIPDTKPDDEISERTRYVLLGPRIRQFVNTYVLDAVAYIKTKHAPYVGNLDVEYLFVSVWNEDQAAIFSKDNGSNSILGQFEEPTFFIFKMWLKCGQDF